MGGASVTGQAGGAGGARGATAGAEAAAGGRGSGDSLRWRLFSIVSDRISFRVDANAFGLPVLSTYDKIFFLFYSFYFIIIVSQT